MQNIPAWFTEARFGIFIHWGLYSIPARHEWIRNHESITDEEYRKYFDIFNPDMFAPQEWARAAKAAGMKYFVITTKHHEGFCLWDSKYTDYKAPNTPAGRDLLREVVDAFRAEGLRVGFYYSLIDWHHPDFTVDRLSPYRGLSQEERSERNAGRDMARYRKYMLNQIEELLTGYGKIDIMWFDFSYPGSDGKGHNDWGAREILDLVYRLQPEIIVDDRLDYPNPNSFATPEQFTPAEPICDAAGNQLVWEGCQTMSGSWGYNRDELTWKTPKQCLQLLIDHVACGGNLILNVGPTARGYFDCRAMKILGRIAEWMKYNSRAIYGCTNAPFEEASGTRYTYNHQTGRLYVHVYNWPFERIHLPGLAGKVQYAQLVQDGSEILFSDNAYAMHGKGTPDGSCTLLLPTVQPECEIPVIEVLIKKGQMINE